MSPYTSYCVQYSAHIPKEKEGVWTCQSSLLSQRDDIVCSDISRQSRSSRDHALAHPSSSRQSSTSGLAIPGRSTKEPVLHFSSMKSAAQEPPTTKLDARLGLAIVPLCRGTGAPFDEHRRPLAASIFRLHALALSVIATATWLAGWLAGWVAGCLSQPVLYQND